MLTFFIRRERVPNLYVVGNLRRLFRAVHVGRFNENQYRRFVRHRAVVGFLPRRSIASVIRRGGTRRCAILVYREGSVAV